MGFTPGKALVDAAHTRADQAATLRVANGFVEHFTSSPADSAGSAVIADAPASPLADFPGVQAAMESMEVRVKDLEVALGQTALGLTDMLRNYESLSSSVAGSYHSLENRIGNNIDPSMFAGVWDGVQHVRDMMGNLETTVRGNQTLTHDRCSRVARDVGGLRERVSEHNQAVAELATVLL